MTSYKNIFLVILVTLLIDFLLSNIFFKKTKFWDKDLYLGKPWRISSEYYHHDLMKNINKVEYWGHNKQKLITNSIGFRDYKNRDVLKKNYKKRILLIGDSFIEGLGYDYEFTLSGLLQSYYSNYEILNSAVSSYSPGIYYYKTKHYIERGYEFDKALVFLDVSDIIDEMHLKYNLDGVLLHDEVREDKSFLKEKIYNVSYYLRDNLISFRLISISSDKTEVFKNYLKDKYAASKFFEKNFFKTKEEDIKFFRMLHVDRGNWTRNIESFKDSFTGVKNSEIYLKKLFSLLKKNNIDSYLIVYPWPSQIYFKDEFHDPYWKNFSEEQNIDFISLYPLFSNADKKKTIFNNFILGDVHWNKDGTDIIFQTIKNSKILEN